MTALSPPVDPSPPTEHAVFRQAVPHIVRRARYHFANLPAGEREELVAEAVAAGYTAACSLVRRGRADRIRTRGFAAYAVKAAASGRLTGSSQASLDAMSVRGRRGHGQDIESLDAMAVVSDEANTRWEAALLDHDTEGPDEIVRRNHDYEHILADHRVSVKARATFEYLAATHGSGKQADLATVLGVNPARVTQLKRELEAVLAGHGYSGPLGRRPAVH